MIKIEEDEFLSLMRRVEEEKSNPDRIFLSDVIIKSRGNYHYLISYNPEDYIPLDRKTKERSRYRSI